MHGHLLKGLTMRDSLSLTVSKLREANARVRYSWRFVRMIALLLAGIGCSSAAAGDRTTLRIWAMGREGEVLSQLMPAFEKEHPGIHVEVQQIPWTAAHEKLLTAYVGE